MPRFATRASMEEARRAADRDPMALYRFLAEVIGIIAAAFGLRISEATQRRWYAMVELAYWLDDLIDRVQLADNRSKVQAYTLFCRLLSGEDPFGRDFEDLHLQLKLAIKKFTALVQEAGLELEAFFMPAFEIAAIAARKRRCRTLRSYVRVLAEEGALFHQLCLACVPECEQEQRNYGRFKVWAGDFNVLGVYGDSLMDFVEDARTVGNQVPHGWLNHWRMVARIAMLVTRLYIREPAVMRAAVRHSRPFLRQRRALAAMTTPA